MRNVVKTWKISPSFWVHLSLFLFFSTLIAMMKLLLCALKIQKKFHNTAWVLRHAPWMLYFTFTRLNLSLDLFPVIEFRHYTALCKPEGSRLYNFCEEILQRFFFHGCLWREFAYFFSFPRIQIWFLKILQIFLHIWMSPFICFCLITWWWYSINIWNFANLHFFGRLLK